MNILNKMIVVLLLYCCLTGCATIFNGRTQRIRVDSNIPGAVVKIDDTIVGQTPFLGDMPRSKKNRTITVQTSSFQPQSQSMTANTDFFVKGNSFIGGVLLGFGIITPLVATMYYDAQVVHDSMGFGLAFESLGLSSVTSSTIDKRNGSAYQYSPTQFYFHFSDEYGTNIDEIILRKYAMLNHSQIAIDAHEENGEYLNALADMMGKKMSREEAIEAIKVALEYSEGDQLAFGNEIVDSFRYHH